MECEVIPRQFLCCKICEEEYKQPKYLPCLHTFCQKCINEYVQNHTDTEGYFPCPVCTTETLKSEDKDDRLPDNVLVQRLLTPQTEKNIKEKLCYFCKNSGTFVDAVTYCFDCDEFLCPMCNDSHKEQEESHKIVPAEEYERKTSRPTTPSQQQIIQPCCEYYDQYDIGAMFCLNCDMLVCADCHTSNHVDHKCAEIVTVAGNFDMKVKEPLEQLDSDAIELCEALKTLDDNEQEVLAKQVDLHDTVKKRTKLLCDFIQDYENILLEEINKRQNQNLEEIKQKRHELRMHLEAIKGVKDFTENLISYGSYEEKVFMRKKVGYRVRELCEEELSTEPLDLEIPTLSEPHVTVETICDMFGNLSDSVDKHYNNGNSEYEQSRNHLNYQHTIDSGHGSDVMDNTDLELAEIMKNAEINPVFSESDSDMLGASNSTNSFRNVKFSEEVEETELDSDCFNLENPKREFMIPQNIQQGCIKGIGVNSHGDIVIGTTFTGTQMVFVLEKRGIIRGQVPIENGWNIHSVSSDGKVAMTIPRGDNRFKVKVLTNDGTGHVLTDTQVESFGLNFVTADHSGRLIITSNRYAQIHRSHGRAAKSGGNIAIYSKDGQLEQRITNDDFDDNSLYLLEKPQNIAVDNKKSKFFVADAGSHTVIGFNQTGELLFEYGNSDTDGEIYQGPDMISVDKYGNVIVTDKREGRIDILSRKGVLKKSFFTDDIPRFVGTTPDKLLMTAMPDGSMKFYEYL